MADYENDLTAILYATTTEYLDDELVYIILYNPSTKKVLKLHVLEKWKCNVLFEYSEIVGVDDYGANGCTSPINPSHPRHDIICRYIAMWEGFTRYQNR